MILLLNVQYWWQAIPYASYNKGSKGTGGAFDLPTQVKMKCGMAEANRVRIALYVGNEDSQALFQCEVADPTTSCSV